MKKKSNLSYRILGLLTLWLAGSFPGFSQNESEIDSMVWEGSYFSFTDSIDPEPVPLRIALVLSDIKANKDLEFARGMFMALDNFKTSDRKIALKLINGGVAAVDSVTLQLDEFEPNIIIGTFEKNFPAYLFNYSGDKNVKTINAFDMRNEFFKTNPNIIQLLTPSNFFNDKTADFFGNYFTDFEFVTIGERDASDNMFGTIESRFPANSVNLEAVEQIGLFTPEKDKQYLFYCFPTKKEDVKQIIEAIGALKKQNPNLIMATVGRPSWITFTDLAKSFDSANVYIPSRFYFDPVSEESKNFIKAYNDTYNHPPVKSFPVYSVMGYDLTNYLVEGVNASGNNFDIEWPRVASLQADYSFKHVPEIAGYYNPLVYVVRFNSTGGADKILIE